MATRLQTSTSRASILVGEEDEANSKRIEEGNDEPNKECNDELSDDKVESN